MLGVYFLFFFLNGCAQLPAVSKCFLYAFLITCMTVTMTILGGSLYYIKKLKNLICSSQSSLKNNRLCEQRT